MYKLTTWVYVDTPGSLTETPCPVGTFSNSVGVIECTACPLGFYSNTTNSTCCVVCLSGTISFTNRTGCEKCPEGLSSDNSKGVYDCSIVLQAGLNINIQNESPVIRYIPGIVFLVLG